MFSVSTLPSRDGGGVRYGSLTKYVGCAALFYILYELIFTARRHATHLGPDISRAFLYCGSLTVLLWLLYPIAWGLCEGGNYIAPDSEGTLDMDKFNVNTPLTDPPEPYFTPFSISVLRSVSVLSYSGATKTSKPRDSVVPSETTTTIPPMSAAYTDTKSQSESKRKVLSSMESINRQRTG